jgi:hypothetical protein
MGDGLVEVLSTEFASGWALTQNGRAAYLYATLDNEIIGFARASLVRRDLLPKPPPAVDLAASILGDGIAGEVAQPKELPNAFVIVFDVRVPHGRLRDIKVRTVKGDGLLDYAAHLRIDRDRLLQVFILGSPRSGTSECAATLARVLELPWFGEGHAAPPFMRAADLLSGDQNAQSELLKFMAAQGFRAISSNAFRRMYYYMHSSASFLDKTPGAPMIGAAAFLAECFPAGKFVYLRRNGISNVLSRMTKFGGSFDDHCADWVAAMSEWLKVKGKLPHFLEIDQEVMLADPAETAQRLASYLEVKQSEAEIAASLRSGALERTGAGIGRSTLSSTGWSGLQIRRFREICGPMMSQCGYAMD